MDELRRIVELYRARGGATPMTWQALVQARYLRAIPTDPDGFVYGLGPWSGDITLGEGSTLAPLPTEPPHDPGMPAAGS
jgi:hypothetical protein